MPYVEVKLKGYDIRQRGDREYAPTLKGGFDTIAGDYGVRYDACPYSAGPITHEPGRYRRQVFVPNWIEPDRLAVIAEGIARGARVTKNRPGPSRAR